MSGVGEIAGIRGAVPHRAASELNILRSDAQEMSNKPALYIGRDQLSHTELVYISNVRTFQINVALWKRIFWA